MASSNRNWPSMFKSKPCNTHHHQWQHDINPSLMSNGCHRAPYNTYTSTVPGSEERSPEPKPRWNPKPEQIRILEAIFNSGMVNPPRDEIRKIRAQLQEFGQVGDANVFYWFQNRKSRSKHKLRHNQITKQSQQIANHQNPQITTSLAASAATTNIITAPSSSSSSSDRSSPRRRGSNNKTTTSSNVIDMPSNNSPTGSVNQQTYFTHSEFLTEPFFFPITQPTGVAATTGLISQGFGVFPPHELSNVVHVNHHQQQQQQIGPCTSLLLSEIMKPGAASNKDHHHHHHHHQEEKIMMKMQQQPQHHLNNYSLSTLNPNALSIAPPPLPLLPTTPVAVTVPSNINQIQGLEESCGVDHGGPGARSTVFINDVAFEVGVGPFNVREAFGEDAVLINSSGHPVLTNEWGITLQSLHHGAFYYLI
ncbi:hypothetical protein Ddye_023837 [Dipteronia dyeriana]|uniref:Homeobox domain-containing protein n=1 Tax=Dipteronia dyeriana TaxID=168575 RepID=A0AAD9WSF6_9ROSI|nr:hypothetical protein Ddye_023837 [Dipteronia dyeriana]